MIMAAMSSWPGTFGPGAASRYEAMPMPRYRPSAQCLDLAPTEVVPFRDRGGLLDLLTGRDPDERLAREHRQRRNVALDVVAPADLERVESELARDHVEHALAEEVAASPTDPGRPRTSPCC